LDFGHCTSGVLDTGWCCETLSYLCHSPAFLLHGYHALLIVSRHSPTANRTASLFLSCRCYHCVSVCSFWRCATLARGKTSSMRACQSNSGYPRRALCCLLDYRNLSAELIFVLRRLRGPRDYLDAQSTCADLRYSITHEKLYAMPFFANRPGLWPPRCHQSHFM
jgi:hypothetical protein